MSKKLLETISSEEYSKLSLVDLTENAGISRATEYRNIDLLRDIGDILTENVLKLTDAEKIARI